jgi:hypothetical protein
MMKRPLSKPIEHGRDELTRQGFGWIEMRKCKRCGVFIEIWGTPTPGARIALEIRPEIDWKLLPHAYFCTGAKPAKTEQTELFA